MSVGDAARRYHALTSYQPDRDWDVPQDDPQLRHDLVRNDMATVPDPVKSYPPGLATVPLPRELPSSAPAAAAVLEGQPSPAVPVDLAQLGRLLFLSAGVVRVAEYGDRRLLFRAAGSAGGRFPLEVYLAARGVPGLADGVHWYDPVDHALVQVGPPPGGQATSIVLTGVPWRTGWRYAERGYRHLFWDAGTVLSHALVLAESVGWRPQLRSVFPDAAVSELIGADGRHEFPLAVLTLGTGEPALVPAEPAVPGRVDRQPQEFPLLTAAQRAGDGDRLGAPWPVGAPVPSGAAASGGAGPADAELVEEVIRRRGSTRRLDPPATLPAATLTWAMAVATRGVSDPQYVAAHGVAGLDSGLYRWTGTRLEPVYRGDLRAEVQRICLGQALGGDAAYVVISAAELDRLDDRRYRSAQLAAGLVAGRLQLAAHAQGFGGCGMTFLDSEIPGLLLAPLAAMIFTCIGVPEYRSRPGGRPGAPVTVRPVLPR